MIQESLDSVVRLIAYYELKEATTILELAILLTHRDREVPGPVKDAILQYLS